MNCFLPLADLIIHCLLNIVGQIWGAYNHWSYQRTKRVGEWDTIVFDDFPTKVSRDLWHLFGQQEVKIRVKKCPGETEMLCSSLAAIFFSYYLFYWLALHPVSLSFIHHRIRIFFIVRSSVTNLLLWVPSAKNLFFISIFIIFYFHHQLDVRLTPRTEPIALKAEEKDRSAKADMNEEELERAKESISRIRRG